MNTPVSPASPAPTTHSVTPFSLQHAPALIEKLLPVQRLSMDVYKERTGGPGQTLTALGSYWKGRKPLVLTRACLLGALLPATNNPKGDLEIFELLMSMDDTSLSKRTGLPKPKEIVAQLSIDDVWQWFTTSPEEACDGLPTSAPFDLDDYEFENDKGKTVPIRLKWREDLTEDQKHDLAVQLLPQQPYRQTTSNVLRAEEIADSVHTHIWPRVNAHLGTQASNYPELVEGAARNLEPHRITYFLTELAAQLHSYYYKHRFISEDADLTQARLWLVESIKTVLAHGLRILGVEAPETM